jgi:hypothetical protein
MAARVSTGPLPASILPPVACRRAARGAAPVLVLLAACATLSPPTTPTPAERRHFDRQSTSSEIAGFLAELAAGHPVAQVVPLGTSAGGRPVQALLLSKELPALRAEPPAPTRLTIMILASQHGTEPSGSEALLRLARDVADGPLTPLLDDVDLILVPDANPDGRDRHRRVNDRGVNLSTNFAVLTEPETRAIHDALLRWQPAVLIDVHESAVFKRLTLGRQGYMTDVEAQLETATHPDVDPGIAAFSRTRILPEVLERVNAQGLRAQIYVGEITDVGQPITHGGLSLRNLRNQAAMRDVMTFLIENRLDPRAGTYPTPRNLEARVGKQYLSVTTLLERCRAHRAEISRIVDEARRRAPRSTAPLHLVTRYAPDPRQPTVHIALRQVDTNEPIDRVFVYHRRVSADVPLAPPAAYAIVAHQDAMRELLARHRIAFETSSAPRPVVAVAHHVRGRETVPGPYDVGWVTEYTTRGRETRLVVPAGALWIPLDQPAGRLLPHLLEPGSSNAVFRDPTYAPLVTVGEDFFVYRIPGGRIPGGRVPEGTSP